MRSFRHQWFRKDSLDEKKLALLWTFLCLPLPTVASELGGWTEQKFSLFSSNDWRQSQDRVDVLSEDAAP